MTVIPNEHAHIIVVGNEKGGAGKTTTSINIIMSLLYDGFSVSSIDIDLRQRSLTHFLQRREDTAKKQNSRFLFPSHYIIKPSDEEFIIDAMKDERQRFYDCLDAAAETSEYVVIDTPGSDNHLSRIAHSYADTIVTPINDSFVDFTVLAEIDDETLEIKRSGIYSESVWEAKKERAARDGHEIDWVVLRNRLTSIDAKNKRNVSIAIEKLAKRLGCRTAEGFNERVIYKELFLKGMSLLDALSNDNIIKPQLSHITARQELRNFIDFLGLQPTVPVNDDGSSFSSDFHQPDANIEDTNLNNVSKNESVSKGSIDADSPLGKEVLSDLQDFDDDMDDVINEDSGNKNIV